MPVVRWLGVAERAAGSSRYYGVVAGAGALTMLIASSMVLLTGTKWWFVGTVAGGRFMLIGLV